MQINCLSLFQATKDALTRDYSFREGEGGTRDQYLKDNNITTHIITAFNDGKITNNNDEAKLLKKSPGELKTSAGSPVLSITNLPRTGGNTLRKLKEKKFFSYFLPQGIKSYM